MSKDKASIAVWGITGILALCMIGAAVYISINNKRAAQTKTMPPAVIITKQEPRKPVQQPPQPVLQPERSTSQAPEPSRTVRQPETSPPRQVMQVPEPQPEQQPQAQPESVPDREGPAIPDETASLDLSGIVGNMRASTKLAGADGDKFPLRHTCYRHNFSPAISIKNAPSSARSYVVFMEKNNEGEENVLHWALFNIAPDITAIAENIPKQPEYNGIRHGANDFGNAEYAGPCDPKGEQQYRIRVFALDRDLSLPAGVDKKLLIEAMNDHIIDMAEINFIHYFKL